MAFMGVMDDLELGDRADSRPLLRTVWKMEYIHESPWRRAHAQVDKQAYNARPGDICNHARHVLADRVGIASGFEIQFGRLIFGRRSTISSGRASSCQPHLLLPLRFSAAASGNLRTYCIAAYRACSVIDVLTKHWVHSDAHPP